jgi:hypothetical protein
MLAVKSFALLILAGLASAINIPFRRNDVPHSTAVKFVSKLSSDADPYNFEQNNQGDNRVIYVGTMLIANNPFEVRASLNSICHY